MGEMKKRVLAVVLVSLGSLSLFAEGQSEATGSYPSEEIEAVITWGAGGLTDNIARNFLPLMEEQLGGATIVPQNRQGASGALGSQYVYDRRADGHTILVTTTESAGVWNVMGSSDLDVSDFEPIILLSSLTPTCYVRADAPWDSVEELVADARSRPGEIISGFAAPGSLGHVSALLFSEYSDSEFNMVPFGGGGKVTAALLGGHVEVAFNPLVSIMENYKADKIKLLATFSNERLLPEVPALGAEIPAFQEVLPYGVMVMILVHKETPDDIVETLTDAAVAASQDERWEEFADRYYIQRMGQTGDAFWEKINSWKPTTTWLLHDAGVATESPAEFGIERP
ncbi:MAG: Bug family tripartite tricarboxylate transporter substrate binding protein [Spirochaetaceae bacterium]